ncbi:hypothetical protein AS149_13045 [Burkholderia cenocepacia]|nr:hypothetical protein AS149_13045 [Burkholderia cenocepacia]
MDKAHAWVDAAYAALSRDPTFVARSQQIDFSKAAATALLKGGSDEPLLAEAPTGTGKTIGYLVGALAASMTFGEHPIQPIVVSTATKALQAQLFTKDLPRLVAAGLIGSREAAVAKGKGNYLCLSQADEVLDLLENGSQGTFFDEGAAQVDPRQLTEMIAAVRSQQWDGDFDAWKGTKVANVRPIAVSSDTCNSKKCPHYEQCAYFRARSRLSAVRVIVANHDLVLRDLMLAAEESTGSLPVASYFIVFDEGHHLPEKAIAVGARESNLTAFTRMLPKLGGLQKKLRESMELQRRLSAFGVAESELDRKGVAGALEDVMTVLADIEVDPDSRQRRFRNGAIPANLLTPLSVFREELLPIQAQLENVLKGLRELMNDLSKPLQEKATDIMRRALDVKRQTSPTLECVGSMLSTGRIVKWLHRTDESMSLHCSPLEGADVLKPILWDGSRTKGVVITSATLRDIQGFKRFRSRSGAPETAATLVLPYTFPYGESQLIVAGMTRTPKQAERREFLEELSRKMPRAINPKEATLVLLPSWTMLRDFAQKMRLHFGYDAVLVQNDKPISLLRADHESRVARGEGSILMGTSTLAEGLDLPGNLCEHVIITNLPFAVPTDPVEQELNDLLGSRYFGERSLPDAMIRLVQQVGRLLRRESDRGRVTIFDRRLASTSYGRQMLNQLPPFQKVVEPLL